jgi:hypothetical protein
VTPAGIEGCCFQVQGAMATLMVKQMRQVHSAFFAPSIAADELLEIRATDPGHADTRPMYGQSPCIVNGIVNYTHDELGLGLNAGFNISGPKLVLITPGGTPDVYDQPRAAPDAGVSKSFGNGFTVKVQVQKKAGVKISMDGRGRATDNAFIERLWRSVKVEHVHIKPAEGGIELYQDLAAYINFYNHQRPHQSLKYETPAVRFEHL